MATAIGLVVENPKDERKFLKGVKHLCDTGVTALPTNYILPIQDRPNITGLQNKSSFVNNNNHLNTVKLPIVDLAQLRSPKNRTETLHSLAKACEEYGFFQVVNHGIPESIVGSMIDVGRRFFEQPFEERVRYMSADIRSPVRCGTSFNQLSDRVFCWRDFLKLSCHPLPTVLPHWPSSPKDLREKGVSYARKSKGLFQLLIGAIMETLGMVETCKVVEEFEDGTHLMVINCFPPCPEPDLTLGMPPHSDYGFLTFVLQDGVKGLQIQCEGQWVTIEPVPNSIVVNVGDHLEIFSNGRYKSVLHRVIVNSSKPRISIASLHSLPFDHVVSPSPKLIDDQNPRLYLDTDFSSFLDYISIREPEHKSFLESRKLRKKNTTIIDDYQTLNS